MSFPTTRVRRTKTDRKVLVGQTRLFVSKLIHFMKAEAAHYAQENTPLIPLENYRQRVLAATGICCSTYDSILMKEAKAVDAGLKAGFSTPGKKRKTKAPKVDVDEGVKRVKMDCDYCVKSEIHYSDEELNFDVYQSTNNAPETENLKYPIESIKVEWPDSDRTEDEEFPVTDQSSNGLQSVTNFFHSKQRVCLSSQGQSICLNVYHNLKQIDGLQHTEAIERTSFLCGISKSKLFNLLREGVKERQKRSDSGLCKVPTLFTEDLETIKKRVRDYYFSDDQPSILGLRSKLGESNPKLQISVKSFRKWLKDTGFRTQRLKNRNVLLENDNLVK